MTRFFYDTEFMEDGRTIDLLSIGIVADDGREYYAIPKGRYTDRAQVSRAIGHPWLRANVIPSLPIKFSDTGPWRWDPEHPDIDAVKPRSQVVGEVQSFILGDDPEQLPYVELWADYGAYDHVALCQLFGSMVDLPEGMPMFTHDIQQEAARLGVAHTDLPRQEAGLHNALADARHAKVRVEFLDAVAARCVSPA